MMTKAQLLEYFRDHEGCIFKNGVVNKSAIAEKLGILAQSLSSAPEDLTKYYMDCAIVYFVRNGKKVPKEFL